MERVQAGQAAQPLESYSGPSAINQVILRNLT